MTSIALLKRRGFRAATPAAWSKSHISACISKSSLEAATPPARIPSKSVWRGWSVPCPTLVFLLCASFVAVGCSGPAANPESASTDRQSAFRVRSDLAAGLNADAGWAGEINENVTMRADEPFRIRFQTEHSESSGERRFRLQYRHNSGPWMNVEVSDFPYPEEATPPVSIVSTEAYENGAETTDVLPGSSEGTGGGVGLNLAAITPAADLRQGEWEWPIVIRHYADGAVKNDEGDAFEFRMADATGCPFGSYVNPVVTLTIPPGHLGGTFVETPGRLGPWEASNGDLYFIMEPTETYNVMMVVKSADGGNTWEEVDPSNRPEADDLEGFATDFSDGIIHILHQTSDEVWYHAFRTSDAAGSEGWDVRDELVVEPEEPPTQVASIAVRSDGSIVGVYGGPEKIHYKIRSTEGTWGNETVVDEDIPPNLSGPQVVLGSGDTVHLAYTGSDGTAWYRRIRPDGTLTPREQIASGLGTTENDVGSILPLVFIPETNTAVVIYRLATGRLWERRIVDHGSPTDPVRVSDRSVAQSPVDSDQTAADAVADGATVHVLFIEEGTGSIYHTRSDAGGTWQPAEVLVDDIQGQWIRGTRLTRGGGPVYGFVYDAGSEGGAGMNRYGELPLSSR